MLPWLNAMRKRASITLALEGRGNDLDARLMAKSKAWAGLAHEQLVDVRLRAAPLAGKLKGGAKGLAQRARDLRVGDKLQSLLQRKP